MKNRFAVAVRPFLRLAAAAASLLAMVTATPGYAEDSVQSVLDCMRTNLPPAVRVQEIELTSFDRDGKSRVMKGKLSVMSDKGLVRAALHISQPADLAGAGYLLREVEGGGEDQMFMYLPALGRVRRITGAAADGSLLGTDLSFNDIKDVENAFGGSDGKMEPAEEVDGHAVWVMSMKPRAGLQSRYDNVRTWVDRKACVTLKVDFYNNGEVLKELRTPAASLQQSGTYWYASDVDVQDMKAGTKTRLHVGGVAGVPSIPSGYFDPHSFYQGY